MPRKTAKLEGLLKEEIKEEDIEEAKKSIRRNIYQRQN